MSLQPRPSESVPEGGWHEDACLKSFRLRAINRWERSSSVSVD